MTFFNPRGYEEAVQTLYKTAKRWRLCDQDVVDAETAARQMIEAAGFDQGDDDDLGLPYDETGPVFQMLVVAFMRSGQMRERIVDGTFELPPASPDPERKQKREIVYRVESKPIKRCEARTRRGHKTCNEILFPSGICPVARQHDDES